MSTENRLRVEATIAAVLVLLAAGCQVPATEPPVGPGTSATGSDSSDIGRRVAPMIAPMMAELTVPGAVVAIKTPDDEWVQAFGTRTIGDPGDLVGVDDHFRIGSNTKTMTGTCILQLVQEGRIGLDEQVAALLPQFRSTKLRGVTVTDLLEMTSGLASYTELESFNTSMDAEPDRAWQPTELVDIGLSAPVHFAPGTSFHYSNTNTVMLGMIVEKLDKTPLEESFRRRIFDKLGLEQTTLPAITSAAIPEAHPQGYMYGTNVSTLTTAALPPAEQKQAQEGTLKPTDYTDLNPSWGWAAGAGISTAKDLITYVEALVGGGLLDPALQDKRLASVHPVGTNGAGYGLALAQFGPMLGHDGSLPGYTSFMGHDPKTNTTLIVLTNLQSAPDGRMVANEVARPIIAELAKGDGR